MQTLVLVAEQNGQLPYDRFEDPRRHADESHLHGHASSELGQSTVRGAVEVRLLNALTVNSQLQIDNLICRATDGAGRRTDGEQ